MPPRSAPEKKVTVTLVQGFALVGYGSAGLTIILAGVLRICWRRGKLLQEP